MSSGQGREGRRGRLCGGWGEGLFGVGELEMLEDGGSVEGGGEGERGEGGDGGAWWGVGDFVGGCCLA